MGHPQCLAQWLPQSRHLILLSEGRKKHPVSRVPDLVPVAPEGLQTDDF